MAFLYLFIPLHKVWVLGLKTVRAAKRYVYPVQLGEEEVQALNATVDRLECSRAEAIREAILHYAEYVKGLEVMKIREVTKEQARREVLAYLKEKDRAWSSEIADSLRLDITLVNNVLAELWGEGEVEPNA